MTPTLKTDYGIKNDLVVWHDPANLRIHKQIKDMPAWPDDDPRFEAMCDDVGERGLIEPLKITAGNEIVDGRHRWRAAKRMQLATVPCVVVEEDKVLGTAVASIIHRRHYTAAQRAYVLAPKINDAWEEAKRRMLGGKSDPRNSVSRVAKTPDEYAAEIHVSVQYLRQARELHELFAAHPEKRKQLTDSDDVTEKNVTLKAFFEARIFREEKPYGLGAVKAGITYLMEAEKFPNKAKGGKPKETEKQLKLFNGVMDDELNRWEYWQKFDDQARAEHFKHVRTKAATIEDADQLEAMAEYHTKLAKEFRAAAKQVKDATSEQSN